MNTANPTETPRVDLADSTDTQRLPLHDRLILILFLIAILMFGFMALGDLFLNLLR